MTNKIFSSYREALAATSNGEGYSSDLLARVVSAKTKRFAERLKAERRLDISTMRTAIFLASLNQTKKAVFNVLDFGGACGYHYLICKALLPAQQFDWRVIETPRMAMEAKSVHGRNELSFFENLEEAGFKGWVPDAIIASSSIQYCPQPLEIFDNLLSLQAKILFITRTPLSMHDQIIVSLQTSQLSANGPGALPVGFTDMTVQYPISYVPKAKLLELASSRDYDLLLSIDEEPATIMLNGVALNRQESLLLTTFRNRIEFSIP